MKLPLEDRGPRIEVARTLPLDFGEIVRDENGDKWVCVGWKANTAGKFPVWAKEMVGSRTSLLTPKMYSCSNVNTLLRQFPDAERFFK